MITMNNKMCAVVLAAGDGKRMKSKYPKPMLEVLFKPMLDWVLDALHDAGISDICIICPPHDDMQANYGDRYTVAVQNERLGTGHAVMQARGFLQARQDFDVVVLNGDAPFIDAATITKAHKAHSDDCNTATVITAHLAEPYGYGRIIHGENGLSEIVEQKDATPEQAKITEVNSGAYWFKAAELLDALTKLTSNNAGHEYYLTDTVGIFVREKKRVGACTADDNIIIMGANSPQQLYELNAIAAKRSIARQMNEGVRFLSTDGVIIAADAKIGCDPTILPGTIIKSGCEIGEGCTIGPNSLLDHSTIGDNTEINASHILRSSVGSGAKIGPFTQLRPNCVIADGVKIGDFVEVKNSSVGKNTSIAHLTYVGDSDVGSGVNFGCGVVTVNYDGKNKARCTIGDGAFIGCNTNLIAPVKIGDGAYTAAGSTVTEDVDAGDLVIARSRQEIKKGYAKGRFDKK